MTETEGIAHHTAARVDTDAGVREQVAFFGGTQRLFGMTYLPSNPAVGVVICSPIHAELLRNYRREVLLARSLVHSGYAVQRFHYRGSGNSDGEPADETFESLCEDTEAAVQRLVEASGVEQLVFVGTRLGAVVAATIARTRDAIGLAMWEPVLNADRYFREIFRGHLVSGLKRADDGSGRKPQQELREMGSVDVLGYSIDRALYESVRRRRLVDDLAVVPTEVLLVRIGGSKHLAGEQEALVSGWRDAGARVETHQLAGSEPWWFGMTPEMIEDEPDRATGLVEVTAEWMRRSVSRQR